MSLSTPHRPSIVGCAFGFGAMGSGLGSFIGMWVGAQVWRANNVELVPLSHTYIWLFRGVCCGIVLGAMIGIGCAALVRRSIDNAIKVRQERMKERG